MIELLRSIVNFIKVIVSLVINIITTFVKFVLKIPYFLQSALQFIRIFVPDFARSYLVAGIMVSLILFFINRKQSD